MQAICACVYDFQLESVRIIDKIHMMMQTNCAWNTTKKVRIASGLEQPTKYYSIKKSTTINALTVWLTNVWTSTKWKENPDAMRCAVAIFFCVGFYLFSFVVVVVVVAIWPSSSSSLLFRFVWFGIVNFVAEDLFGTLFAYKWIVFGECFRCSRELLRRFANRWSCCWCAFADFMCFTVDVVVAAAAAAADATIAVAVATITATVVHYFCYCYCCRCSHCGWLCRLQWCTSQCRMPHS